MTIQFSLKQLDLLFCYFVQVYAFDHMNFPSLVHKYEVSFDLANGKIIPGKVIPSPGNLFPKRGINPEYDYIRLEISTLLCN